VRDLKAVGRSLLPIVQEETSRKLNFWCVRRLGAVGYESHLSAPCSGCSSLTELV